MIPLYFLRSSKQINTSAINSAPCDLKFLEIQGNSSHGERKCQHIRSLYQEKDRSTLIRIGHDLVILATENERWNADRLQDGKRRSAHATLLPSTTSASTCMLANRSAEHILDPCSNQKTNLPTLKSRSGSIPRTEATGTAGCGRFHRMNGIAPQPIGLNEIGHRSLPAGISCGSC